MKILLFTLIVILAALNIFCSLLYSRIIKMLPGQLTGRITLNKLNKVFENARNDEERNLIIKCRYAYTVYLIIFYLFIAVVLIVVVGILKR